MTSIKVKFRPSTSSDRAGVIYYQIIHERKVRMLVSGYRVFPCEWDESRSMVREPDGERRQLVLDIRERIGLEVARLIAIKRRLDERGTQYTASDLVAEFKRYGHDYTLVNFMEGLIAKLRLNGRLRTSETYRSTLNSFRKFLCDASRAIRLCRSDIMLDGINAELMEDYEGWLREMGVAPNTVSFYTRVLRAVYNRAVSEGAIVNLFPFRHVYTGIAKTVKRALPISAIRKIKLLNLSGARSLDYARDMFMMSFYLRGMSFIDMAFLRKTDLKYGFVSYRRRKTGQRLVIKWTGEMQAILDKYPENATDYLLPIIRHPGTNERCTYRNVGYNINHSLKAVGEMAACPIPLTLYVARHSWASAAKAKGIPLGIISEGMGHDSETTTRIYLASLDTSAVDRANSMIIRSL